MMSMRVLSIQSHVVSGCKCICDVLLHHLLFKQVPFNLNMMIANGPIDRPMTGSKMIVYGDDHLPCPLEVHWMETYE